MSKKKKRVKLTKEEKQIRRKQIREMRRKYPRHLAVRLAVGSFIVLILVLGIASLVNMSIFFINGFFRSALTVFDMKSAVESALQIYDKDFLQSLTIEQQQSVLESCIMASAGLNSDEIDSFCLYYGNDLDGYAWIMGEDYSKDHVTLMIDPNGEDHDLWEQMLQGYEMSSHEELQTGYYSVPREISGRFHRTNGSTEVDGRQIYLSGYRFEGDENHYILMVCINIMDILLGQSWYYLLFLNMIAIIIVVVMLSTIRRTHKKVIRPLTKLMEAINQFQFTSEQREDPAEWIYNAPEIRSKDEMQATADFMAIMTERMKHSVTQLLAANSEKERISTELGLATRIQNSMLPSIFPPFPDRQEFTIFASMDPAKEVGGDFYDFFFIDESHLGLVIADVSGKGVPAALFMMSSMLVIQNIAKEGYSPAKLLERANNHIAASNTVEMFVTVWFGILDTQTGIITAANAGHEYPAIRHGGASFELIKDRHGFVLGEMDGMKYREYEIELQQGDTLFVYTDGVPEAQNSAEEFFGTGRMLNALNEYPDDSPEKLIGRMKSRISEYVGEADQFDDVTMLCIRYNGLSGVSTQLLQEAGQEPEEE